MSTIPTSSKTFVGVTFLALILGGFLGAVIYAGYEQNQCADTEYRYLNPTLLCGAVPVISKTSFLAFENDLRQFIEAEQAKGGVSQASVYFRDLQDGSIFGIHEREKFTPASLLKLPLAIAYLNLLDDGILTLNEKVKYDFQEDAMSMQTFKPLGVLRSGNTYTIEELLENMLEKSDNAAYITLYAHLIEVFGDNAELLQTYQELGLIDPRDQGSQTLDVRGYASIFRVLYNGSYLKPKSANQLFKWLAKSEFKSGLVAGVPTALTVAHKFGERSTDDGKKQLHDCGIVYYPGNPYLLCVMTYGTDWTKLEDVIAAISRMVYAEVDSRRN